MPHCHIEQVARRNACRIAVWILRPGRRNRNHALTRYCAGAHEVSGRTERWKNISAEQPCLYLLVGGQACQVNRRCCIRGERHCARDQSAVIAPVEARSMARACLSDIEQCVVSLNFSSWSMRNGSPALAHGYAPEPPICGGKKRAATGDITNESGEAMEIRHAQRAPRIRGSSSYATRWGT